MQTTEIEHFDRSPIRWDGPKPDLLKITSGTTGAPRAVRFRESQLLADCRNICETMGIRPNDVNFGVIPIFPFVRVQQPHHSPSLSGNRSGLFHRSNAASGLRPSAELRSNGVSRDAGAISGARALPDVREPASIRLCISAGAPLALTISRQFHSRFGLKIHSFYGSSECGGIAYDRSEDPERPSGFVGTPMNGVEITKIDDDRIAVRGPNVADGYFPDSDRQRAGRSAIRPRRYHRMDKSGSAARRARFRFCQYRRKKGSPGRHRRTSPQTARRYRRHRLWNSLRESK